MKKLLFTALLFCFTGSLPSGAQTSPENAIRAEILEGWVQSDGTRMAGVKLTLAPGWKTYWRSPGDAGIPPQFDWAGSGNLRGANVIWPSPEVFNQSGMQSIGYSDEVVLPLKITPSQSGKPVRVKLDLDLGVCSDICVPRRIELSAMLSTATKTPTPEIAAALAARPYSAADAGVTSATCALYPGKDGPELETQLTMPSAGPGEVIVIEPGAPNLWAGEMETRRQGGQLIARGPLSTTDGGAMALNRSAIRITVLGGNHAVEVTGCTAR